MGFGGLGAGRVQILKRVDAEGMIDHGADAARRGLRGSKRGDAGDLIAHGGAADGFLVVKRLAAKRRIDDEIDLAALDVVDDVGPPFIHFINGFDFDTGIGS